MRARLLLSVCGVAFFGSIGVATAQQAGAAVYQAPGGGFAPPYYGYGYGYGLPPNYGYGSPYGPNGANGANPYLAPPPPPTEVDQKQLPQGPKATTFPSTSGGVIDASPPTIPDETSQQPGYAGALSVDDVADSRSAFYGGSHGTTQKWTAIAATARRIGLKAGFASEAAKLNEKTIEWAALLDARYDFEPLLLMKERVVPPVIIEAGPSAEKAGDKMLFLTLGSFQIIRDARVTAKVPNWREYVLMPVSDPHPPGVQLVKTEQDQAVWDRAVRAGWAEGVEEARAAFVTGLDRLERDFEGMKTYHRLAREGALSILEVSVRGARARVLNDGRRALIEPRVVQLVVEPRFRATKALTAEADRVISAYQEKTSRSVKAPKAQASRKTAGEANAQTAAAEEATASK